MRKLRRADLHQGCKSWIRTENLYILVCSSFQWVLLSTIGKLILEFFFNPFNDSLGEISSAPLTHSFPFLSFFTGRKCFVCPQPFPGVSSVQYVTIKDNHRSDLWEIPLALGLSSLQMKYSCLFLFFESHNPRHISNFWLNLNILFSAPGGVFKFIGSAKKKIPACAFLLHPYWVICISVASVGNKS